MAPVYEINVEDLEPMSRTYQYRKVMKPMLERKRRARINKCLDELKDLMVGALQHEGESITKLEKADVLELTVTHLKKLKRHNALSIPAASHSQEKFTSGFRKCANEVSKFVSSSPGVDIHVSNRLMSYLAGCVSDMDKITVNTNHSIQTASPSPPTTPITVSIPSKMYTPPASPDNTRSMQMSPPTSRINNSSSQPPSHLQQSSVQPSAQPSYIRVPQLDQPLLVQQTSINPNNITYKIANHHHLIHQQQHQQYQQSSPHHHHHQSPPTPPLSVGAPSPVQSHRPGQVASVSPKPTSLSPVPRLLQSPVHPISTDGGPVWRPW